MVNTKNNSIRVLISLKIVIGFFILSNLSNFKNNIMAKNLNLPFYFNMPDTTINVNSDTTINFSGFIKNESNETLNLKIIRTLNSTPESWSTSICVNFLCLSETVDTILSLISPDDSLQCGVLVNVIGVGLGNVKLDISNTEEPDDNISVNISANFLSDLETFNQSFTGEKNYINQNYPNPFNSETLIKYNLPNKSFVDIAIFDIVGRSIRSFSQKGKDPGTYIFRWDGLDESLRPVKSGVYIILIKSNYFQESKKMTFAK